MILAASRLGVEGDKRFHKHHSFALWFRLGSAGLRVSGCLRGKARRAEEDLKNLTFIGRAD